MTCGKGIMCHHRADCPDLHCPGRSDGDGDDDGNATVVQTPRLAQIVSAMRRIFAWLVEDYKRVIDFYIAIVVAIVIALLLAGAHNLDIADHSTEAAQADALADAIKLEAAQARFAKAAAEICGHNGAWVMLDGATIQCYTHRGQRTNLVAQVRP